MDYSGFDRHNWRPRSSEKHKKDAMAIRKLQTLSTTVKAESQAGCWFSELMNLP